MEQLDDSLQELFLAFYCVGLGDQTQVVKLGDWVILSGTQKILILCKVYIS